MDKPDFLTMTKEEFLTAFKATGDKISGALSGHIDEDSLQLYRNCMKGYEASIKEADDDAYLHQLVIGFIHGVTIKHILEK